MHRSAGCRVLPDANAGEQCHEVFDLDLVERANSLLDLFGELAVDAAGGELVKLGARVVPGERARRHARIVTHLVGERGAVREALGDRRTFDTSRGGARTREARPSGRKPATKIEAWPFDAITISAGSQRLAGNWGHTIPHQRTSPADHFLAW